MCGISLRNINSNQDCNIRYTMNSRFRGKGRTIVVAYIINCGNIILTYIYSQRDHWQEVNAVLQIFKNSIICTISIS